MFFFEAEESEAIVSYVKEKCPAEVAEIIRKADETAENTFIFDCRWDLESTFFPVKFPDKIDWLYQPADDPEWTYAFNRMRYWICLGQAYAITGDEKYPEAFVSQLEDWVKRVRLGDKKCGPAWRTIEAGFRLEYWTKAWQYMLPSAVVTSEVRQLFLQSVREHGDFIVRSYNDFNRISNWGVLANHGLFMAGILLEDKAFISTALKRLEAEAKTQVFPDGMQWEQSPMYHNEVLHDFLDVLILAERNSLSEKDYPQLSYIKETTCRMCYACSVFQKPDHHQIMMGDSDDLDVSWNLARGAYYFRDNKLKARSIVQFDFDTIWDTGYKAALEYEAMGQKSSHLASKKPECAGSGQLDDRQPEAVATASLDGGNLSTTLETSGNVFFRNSWKEDASFVHFHCGTMGAGHGHSDQLHVDFSANGEDILVDSGRFTYVTKKERFDYKNPPAHNTITVDDVNYCHWTDSWAADVLCKPVNFKSFSADEYCYCEGGHTGYLIKNDKTGCRGGVLVNRRLLFIKPDILFFVDEFIASDNSGECHTYKQFFHFSDTGSVSKAGGLTSGGACQPADKYPHFLFRGEKTAAGVYTCPNLEGADFSAEILDTEVSRHYNSSRPNKSLCVTVKASGFRCIPTVFFTGKKEEEVSPEHCSIEALPVRAVIKDCDLSPELVEAWNIKKGSRFYTVVAAHQEFAAPTEMFSADGCTGYASFMVFDRVTGKYTLLS